MRAAAIFGLGSSESDLEAFQNDESIEWRVGLPTSADEVDIVLIFGGDGTIHRHLSPLVNLKRPVLVVPKGSGNDFGRALNLSKLEESLAAFQRFCIAADNVKEIDLGVIRRLTKPPERAHPIYFCCVASCGLDAAAAKIANALPSWLKARGGYVLSLGAALWQFRSLKMTIQFPGESNDAAGIRKSVPAMLLAFANATSYGGGMRIAPQAELDDGLLDCCLVHKVGKLRLTYLFPSVYFGRHLRIPEVEYFKASRFLLESDAPVDVFADGEYVCRTPIEVSVAPKTLRVVTP
jgi:diacylglycerol kinase (ATP)